MIGVEIVAALFRALVVGALVALAGWLLHGPWLMAGIGGVIASLVLSSWEEHRTWP
jgi:hypothetical protein